MKTVYKIILQIFVFIFLICINLKAQDEYFTILSFSGNVNIQIAGKKWIAAQTGYKIEKNNKIKFDKNTYSALMYKDGRTIEIKTAGTYSYKKLIDLLAKNSLKPMQKFSQFVLSELTKHNEQKKDLKTFAAVVRIRPDFIETAIPAFTKIIDSKFEFKWYKLSDTKKYIFNLTSPSGSIIYMNITTDTSLSLDLAVLNINRDVCYNWFVYDADSNKVSSDTSCVMFMQKYEAAAITDSIKEYESALETNDSPLIHLVIASYLESNDLNFSALKHYNKVLSLVPEVEQYKTIAVNFLIKNKLYKQASLFMKD